MFSDSCIAKKASGNYRYLHTSKSECPALLSLLTLNEHASLTEALASVNSYRWTKKMQDEEVLYPRAASLALHRHRNPHSIGPLQEISHSEMQNGG
jgi:hypothetical protein